MKRPLVPFLAVLALVSLTVAACSQPAPAPTPTRAAVPAPTTAPAKPAEPTKAAAPAPTAAKPAEPTKAAAPAPTAAKTVDFPQKGKVMTMIVPFAAGGGGDVSARILVPPLERALGAQFNIVNKGGAGGQIALTDLAMAAPDGYTVGGMNLPATTTMYLDPDRKATFSRKDLQPLAIFTYDALAVAVRGDSPYKTFKELVDGAKANPGKLTAGDVGILTQPHLGILQTEKATDTKFAIVHFDSSAAALAALLGGHLDVQFLYINNAAGQIKAGDVRILGIMDVERSKFLPNVPTVQEQGYKLTSYIHRGYSMPAKAPKEIVDILVGAFKTAILDDQIKKTMDEQMNTIKYMGPAEFSAVWEAEEIAVKPLMELAKEK